MTQQQFITRISNQALLQYQLYNILPSLTISQAILESNWGKSAPGNMLFGMKWSINCGFEYQELWTKEYHLGKYINVKAKFRKYDSWEDSINDHANLLRTKRYERVLKSRCYQEATYYIKVCGYATSKTYTESLQNVIETYQLYKYDDRKPRDSIITKDFKWKETFSSVVAGNLYFHAIEPPVKLEINVIRVAIELQKLRSFYNKSIIVNSWYRTEEYNKTLKDSSKNSMHLQGLAADVRPPYGVLINDFYKKARDITNFKGFGISNSFLHVDLRDGFAVWHY